MRGPAAAADVIHTFATNRRTGNRRAAARRGPGRSCPRQAHARTPSRPLPVSSAGGRDRPQETQRSRRRNEAASPRGGRRKQAAAAKAPPSPCPTAGKKAGPRRARHRAPRGGRGRGGSRGGRGRGGAQQEPGGWGAQPPGKGGQRRAQRAQRATHGARKAATKERAPKESRPGAQKPLDKIAGRGLCFKRYIYWRQKNREGVRRWRTNTGVHPSPARGRQNAR